MPRTAHPQKKRIKRVRVPKEILIELIKRDLSVRGLARKYGVSDAVISNILGGFPYKTDQYFGFKIYKVADTYKSADGTVKPVIDPNAVYVLGELPWKLKFLSLDDIEYGPIATPLLLKVVKDPMGKSLSIIAESKPFPIPKINAVIKATVVS